LLLSRVINSLLLGSRVNPPPEVRGSVSCKIFPRPSSLSIPLFPPSLSFCLFVSLFLSFYLPSSLRMLPHSYIHLSPPLRTVLLPTMSMSPPSPPGWGGGVFVSWWCQLYEGTIENSQEELGVPPEEIRRFLLDFIV
jgi:hypothetical protein